MGSILTLADWVTIYLFFLKSPALFSFLWSGGHGLLFQRLLMISSSWFNQSQPTSSHGKHRPPTTTWKVSTASAMSCASILLSAIPTTVTMGCMVGWTFIYIYTQLNKAICNCTDLLLWVCVCKNWACHYIQLTVMMFPMKQRYLRSIGGFQTDPHH